MSKRILSLVLTLTLILGSFSMAFAAPSDVVGTPVEDAVERLGNLGILTGYTDGTFKPDNNITRAEFSAVISRARGLEKAAINSKGNTAFADVPASHWASGYVNVSEQAGLIKGVGIVNGKNSFAPEANISYEQAVTMVVRALGYEPAANVNGGYPQGHLIVASQEGLLKNVNGVQGEKATRALVAQLLDNALDVPKMIQVGYGDQAKWVKSGTEWTEEKFLFDDLGLERLVKATITEAKSDKNKVTIEGLKHKNDSRTISKSLKVSDSFNFAGLEGLKVTAWYDDSKGTLVDVRLDTDYTVKFDAIEVTKGEEEIKLITEDKKYDVKDNKDGKAIVRINGDKKDIKDLEKNDKYSFAKIIIDEYNDASWIEVYSLDEMIVVKEVKTDLIKGYDNEEIDDADDYTIIKDGKQISVKELKDKDLVLYNSKEDYAVVITNSKKGKIDRVYENGFKFEGTTYDYKTPYGTAKYINGDNLNDVDSDVAEEMQDNGEATIFLSFDKKVLLVSGEVKEISSNYVMVTSTTKDFNTRGEAYKTLDVLNSEGKEVKYEVKLKDINDSKEDFLKSEANWNKAIVAGNVIKLSLDSKNVPSKVETTNSKLISSKVDVDANYIEGYKTKGNALVFWKDGEEKVKDYSVLRWSDAKSKFSEVQSGEVFANKDGEVVAIYAEQTNNETKTKDVVGVIKKVKELSRKDNRYDITIEVNGKEVTYEGKNASFASLKADDIVALQVTEKDQEAKSWSTLETEVVTVASASTSKLTDTTKVEYNIEGKYYEKGSYDELKTMNAKDVVGKKVTLYFQPKSTKFVQVVVLGDNAPTDTELKEAKAALNTRLNALKALELDANKYTADSIKKVEDAITSLGKAAAYTDAKAVNDAVAAVKDVKLVEKTPAGEVTIKASDVETKEIFAGMMFGVKVTLPTEVSSAKIVKVDNNVQEVAVNNGSYVTVAGALNAGNNAITIEYVVDGATKTVTITK